MLFMNEYEIDEAVRLFAYDPVLGPAARTLENLRDWANRNSDGWAYWPKPCRAAKQLQQLLQDARRSQFGQGQPPSADQLKVALRPIKAFRTRQGADFEIVEA